nr:hypothetical protein 7 [Elusimicrobiota bacterium]
MADIQVKHKQIICPTCKGKGSICLDKINPDRIAEIYEVRKSAGDEVKQIIFDLSRLANRSRSMIWMYIKHKRKKDF